MKPFDVTLNTISSQSAKTDSGKYSEEFQSFAHDLSGLRCESEVDE